MPGQLRMVVWSIVALWLAYFVLTSLRGVILGYEVQQAFGIDLHAAMLWRRALVCLAGVGITLLMWLALRFVEDRSIGVKIAASLVLALPAAATVAQVNQMVFAPVQHRIGHELQKRNLSPWSREDAGDMLDRVAPQPGQGAQVETRASGRLDPGRFRWLQLVDVALGRYFLFVAWASIYFTMLAIGQTRVAQQRGERFRSAAKAAELRSLRYQVNPHFLFNALNSLSALVLTGRRERAEEMIQTLSRFYRHSLADAPAASVTLADELALQRHYLDIEAVRFPDRLVVAFDTEEAVLTARVPGMILQPLVENAVKYGVAASTRPVTVTVSAARRGDMLMLEVCDDGTAASDTAPSGSETGLGIGLANVVDRLRALYGEAASLETGPVERDGNAAYCTTLMLPFATHD